jgi:hypothetical protein
MSTYTELVKERTDIVYAKTTTELAGIIRVTRHDSDGTVAVSAEDYSSSFNLWLNDFGKLNFRPILADALFNVSNIFETSLFLATHGFYRCAISELRTALDDFLTRTYFDLIDVKMLKSYWVDKEGNFVDWVKPDKEVALRRFGNVQQTLVVLSGSPKAKCKRANAYSQWSLGHETYTNPDTGTTKKFPHFKEIIAAIFKEQNLSEYDAKYGFKKKLEMFYFELSKYTHNRPNKAYKHGNDVKSSILNIHFDSEEFMKWYQYLKESYNTMSIILILRCPGFIEINSDELARFKTYEPKIVAQIEEILKK